MSRPPKPRAWQKKGLSVSVPTPPPGQAQASDAAALDSSGASCLPACLACPCAPCARPPAAAPVTVRTTARTTADVPPLPAQPQAYRHSRRSSRAPGPTSPRQCQSRARKRRLRLRQPPRSLSRRAMPAGGRSQRFSHWPRQRQPRVPNQKLRQRRRGRSCQCFRRSPRSPRPRLVSAPAGTPKDDRGPT